MRNNSELMVITKAKDIANYSFTIAENAPKKFRFTLISKIHNLSLEIIENLIMANEIILGESTSGNAKRKNYQDTALSKLKVLDALIMIARDHKCILPKQYEYLSRLIFECVKLLKAWQRSDEKRLGI